MAIRAIRIVTIDTSEYRKLLEGKNCHFLVNTSLLKIFEYLVLVMRNYLKLRVWQKGMEISVKCYQLVSGFSKNDRFEIGSQILRSAVSIPSNIAEGASRKTQKESLRYLDIALGSVFELNTQLLIVEKVISNNNQLLTEILNDIDEEGKMLTSYQLNFIGNP